jgi:hypothetical protein
MTDRTWFDVPVPSRMKHLPRDRRGYPIPAVVLRDRDGMPHFTINDSDIRQGLIVRDECSICGGKLFRGRWFVGGPLSAFHPDGLYIDSAVHRECAVYALQVCPYLAAPVYSHRIDAKQVDVEKTEHYLFIDESVMPTRPKLFVLGMAHGQTLIASDRTVDIRIRPIKPLLHVEFWRDGARLPDQAGLAIVADALAAPLPPQVEPRLILAGTKSKRGNYGR